MVRVEGSGEGKKMLIVLISCVKKKKDSASLTKDMYSESTLFKGAYQYAHKLGADKIFILSAKYGLLEENDLIEPYNETLKTKSKIEREKWASDVLKKLSKKTDLRNDKFIFLAGKEYREHLIDSVQHSEVPLKGLGIGKQLAFYKKENL